MNQDLIRNRDLIVHQASIIDQDLFIVSHGQHMAMAHFPDAVIPAGLVLHKTVCCPQLHVGYASLLGLLLNVFQCLSLLINHRRHRIVTVGTRELIWQY